MEAKNGTVLKMGAYFVERGWFKKVSFIFLIKGHTKNACDRMFNVLKVKWHNSNVYTLQQALHQDQYKRISCLYFVMTQLRM